MNVILFDGTARETLLPLTYTRPVADLRVGILTIREKWEKLLGFTTTTLTEEYLEAKFPMVEMERNVMINASFLPNEKLVDQIIKLQENQAIYQDDEVLAFFTTNSQEEVDFEQYEVLSPAKSAIRISHCYDIFVKNDEVIRSDFELITNGRKSQPLPPGVIGVNTDDIFIEEGAEINFCHLNASKGPIYIGKDCLIMEGSLIRGPFAMGERSVIKMGAKVYGATTLGPGCTIGGEVKNAVLFGNSNKGHEGYLGDSVIGEWCNLGADTNNSNLKNNYSEVRLWNYETENFAKTGLQFCGLIMGDHSKCAINTMFNTGTVVGVSANIYGGNFQRNFVPSFSWGGSSGFRGYQLKQAVDTARLVLERKAIIFDDIDQEIMKHIFDASQKYRNFE